MRSIERTILAGSLAEMGVLALLAAGCRSTVAESPPAAAESPATTAGEIAVHPPAVQAHSDEGSAPDPGRAQDSPGAAPPAREFEAPAGWESLTNLAFERAIDGWLPAGEARHASEATLADLRRALGGLDVTAVRAAVMLARTLDPGAGEVLLERLEQRVATPARESQRDAADVVAAAAFGVGMSARKAPARLNGLAIGKRPHPSLAARVECARSAIALGRDDSIPYLLSVLRAGTTAGRVVGSDENEDDLAWAQVRAAEALASRAGTKSRFLPEGSVREREEEAARLEALLPPPRNR